MAQDRSCAQKRETEGSEGSGGNTQVSEVANAKRGNSLLRVGAAQQQVGGYSGSAVGELDAGERLAAHARALHLALAEFVLIAVVVHRDVVAGLAAVGVRLPERLVAALEDIGLRVPHIGVSQSVVVTIAVTQVVIGAGAALRRKLAVEDDDRVALLAAHEHLLDEILVGEVDSAAHMAALELVGEAAVDNI